MILVSFFILVRCTEEIFSNENCTGTILSEDIYELGCVRRSQGVLSTNLETIGYADIPSLLTVGNNYSVKM